MSMPESDAWWDEEEEMSELDDFSRSVFGTINRINTIEAMHSLFDAAVHIDAGQDNLRQQLEEDVDSLIGAPMFTFQDNQSEVMPLEYWEVLFKPEPPHKPTFDGEPIIEIFARFPLQEYLAADEDDNPITIKIQSNDVALEIVQPEAKRKFLLNRKMLMEYLHGGDLEEVDLVLVAEEYGQGRKPDVLSIRVDRAVVPLSTELRPLELIKIIRQCKLTPQDPTD